MEDRLFKLDSDFKYSKLKLIIDEVQEYLSALKNGKRIDENCWGTGFIKQKVSMYLPHLWQPLNYKFIQVLSIQYKNYTQFLLAPIPAGDKWPSILVNGVHCVKFSAMVDKLDPEFVKEEITILEICLTELLNIYNEYGADYT